MITCVNYWFPKVIKNMRFQIAKHSERLLKFKKYDVDLKKMYKSKYKIEIRKMQNGNDLILLH